MGTWKMMSIIFFGCHVDLTKKKKGPGGFRVFIGTLLMEYEGEYF